MCDKVAECDGTDESAPEVSETRWERLVMDWSPLGPYAILLLVWVLIILVLLFGHGIFSLAPPVK